MTIAQPLISVLLPVGKEKRFLNNAIESIRGQTIKDYELLTQEDDGRGITKTLIGLAQKARGEFLARMDADDISKPNRLEVQLKYLKNNPGVQLVGSWAELIDENGKTIGLERKPSSWNEIKREAFFRNPFIHPAWMMRRSWFERIRGYNPEFPIVQDWELILRRVWYDRMENIPQTLIKLRIHTKSHSFIQNRRQVYYGLKARFSAIARRNVSKWKTIYLLPKLLMFIVPADIKILAKKLLIEGKQPTPPSGRSNIENKQILGIVLPIGQSRDQLLKSGQWDLWQFELEEYRKHFDSVELFEYRFNDWRRFPETMLLPFVQPARFKRCSVLKAIHLSAAIPCLMAKILYRVPYALSFGYRYDKFALVEKKWLQWLATKLLVPLAVKTANLVFVPTQELKLYVESLGAKQTVLFPNGVDIDLFKPDRKSRLIAHRSPLTVLFVGRLEWQKNLSTLIRAVSEINRGDVIFVGSGSQKQKLLDLANKLKVKMEIKSPVDNNLLPVIYNQADIFVLPSLVEGHPKALLEAMSCGLACMATDIPGPREIITNNQNGLLVQPTVKNLSSGLKKLSKNEALRIRLGQEARITVLERFDKQKLLQHEISVLLSHFESVEKSSPA